MSRYHTTETGTNTSARVAGFKVAVDSMPTKTVGYIPIKSWGQVGIFDDESLFSQPDDQIYRFSVQNFSEVAVRAKLMIEHHDGVCVFSLPDECKIEVEDILNVPGSVWANAQPVDMEMGAEREFYVKVNSHPEGHKVDMRVDYVQID